ncbi:MAG: phosphate/phosphite/phosphonate ABC transporter substrate-binding protein [Magnetococcales bacterium]|nr:phosphate/phosphite/phosphonate ABC transporter substrate-binding protein [Magnetococcales bacterium]
MRWIKSATLAILLVAFGLLALKFNQTEEVVHQVNFNQIAEEASPKTVDNRPVLRVAVAAMISPKETKKYYNELLRLIGQRLGMRTEFYQRKTYAEINDLLETKQIDTAFVCAGPYVSGHEKFGMEIIAVPVVNDQPLYYSYFLVHRDSPITTFAELRGKRFAFTDPDSNTGRLVPTYVLAQQDETPESFFGETFFTHSHDNSIQAVAEGLADGAAVDSLIWDFMDRINPKYTRFTRIIEKSPPYGIPPIVVHPDLPLATKERLRQIFTELHNDPEAIPLLRLLQIQRFDSGNDEIYDSVRLMENWLHDHNQDL